MVYKYILSSNQLCQAVGTLCNKSIRNMSSLGNKFDLPPRYSASESNVWDVFSKLAQEYKPVNLGQGFPDYPSPPHVYSSLADVSSGSNVLLHQYSRGRGHLKLAQNLCKLYSPLVNRELDVQTELMVSSGAYEALFCTFLGHVNPGDEVILIEPFFDCYDAMVKAAGGTSVFIPLKPTKTTGKVMSSDWKLDMNELANLFNSKTKLILVNTPHNPVGKVFTKEELTAIADLCKKWNVLCVADEVYEWMVYKPNEHIRMATLPGMWDRTLTICSAGKTFSVTGWKTGWAYGPANLMKNLFVVHQNCVNSCNTPTQEAVAQALEVELARFGKPECYMESLAEELRPKRDFMAKFLTDVGMVPTIPEAGYFMMADWSSLADKVDLNSEDDKYKDYRFAKWMTKNQKLQGIPPSAFYSESHRDLGGNFIRYCFIKDDDTLKKAESLLKKWVGEPSKL